MDPPLKVVTIEHHHSINRGVDHHPIDRFITNRYLIVII